MLAGGQATNAGDGSIGTADSLLAILVTLDAPVPTPLLAVAANSPEKQVSDLCEQLATHQLIDRRDDVVILTNQGRASAPETGAPTAVTPLLLLARHLLEGATSSLEEISAAEKSSSSPLAWLQRHHELIPRVAEALSRHHEHDRATELVSAWWPFAARQEDPGWEARLSDSGEDAAISSRKPEVLARLLNLSAQAAQRRDQHLRAEAQWIRALAVWREAGKQHEIAAVATELGRLYLARTRLHRALDAFYTALAAQQHLNDPLEKALTQWRIGVVQLAAGHAGDAVAVLTEAVDTACAAGQRMRRSERADVHIALGTALWRTEAPGQARRAFSNALACLVDVDERRADQVRAALATPDRTPLPLQLEKPRI